MKFGNPVRSTCDAIRSIGESAIEVAFLEMRNGDSVEVLKVLRYSSRESSRLKRRLESTVDSETDTPETDTLEMDTLEMDTLEMDTLEMDTLETEYYGISVQSPLHRPDFPCTTGQ